MRWRALFLCLAMAAPARALDYYETLARLTAFESDPPSAGKPIHWVADQLEGPGQVRAKAVKVLVAVGDRAWRYVVDYLEPKHPVETRLAAAEVLARIGATLDVTPKPYGPLTDALADPEPRVRRCAATQLARASRSGVRRLAKELGARDRRARMAAADAFGLMDAPPIEELIRALGDKRARVRQAAAWALAAAGDKAAAAAPALVEALDDPEGPVRGAVLLALGRAGKDPSALFAALADPDGDVAAGAARGLAHLGAEAAAQLLAKIGTLDARVFEEAAYALAKGATPPLEALRHAVGSPDAPTRQAAVATLGRVPPKLRTAELADLLVTALRDGSAAVRAEAAEALGAYPPELARPQAPALAALLADKDADVRAVAALALGRIGTDDPSTRAALDKQRKDPDRFAAAAAATVLWRIDGGDPAPGRDGLIEILARRSDPGSRRARAARALGVFREFGAEAVEALTLAATSTGDRVEVRAAAAHALGDLLVYRRHACAQRGERVAGAPDEVRRAVSSALSWLAKRQDDRGGWKAEDPLDGNGHAEFDPGVSAIATLAFLNAGHTHMGDGPFRENVRKARSYLVGMVSDRRLRASEKGIVQVAWITQALCETMLMTGDRSDREAIGEALRYIEEARNPYMAWRYAPRSGRNDTHCTVRMLMTLRTGMMCGYPIADDAVRVPLEWIDKMTLPEWGEIGYDATTTCFRSGVQAKKFALTMAMTAAGTYGRFLCGEGLASNKPAKKGIELCLDASPAWEEDAFVDMYYWYWGSLLAQQAGTSSPWNAALRKALLPHQDEDGSWPADGAWGWTAGRVYATGISVLALLAPYRFERDFFRERELHPLYARAVKVLRHLEQDQRDELHRAAADALATAGLP